MTTPSITDEPLINALEARSYWCFISYRHADNHEDGRQWATWLQYQLETYEVPPDLVGKVNDRGEIIPSSIFPVFRDEEELSTGNLATRIYHALDHSRILVVLCSPRAVSSQHVDNEIRYFKTRRDETTCLRSIHAVIIAGDPTADGDNISKCFPDSLRYAVAKGEINYKNITEPLAADLRLADGSQGWTNPQAHKRVLETQQRDISQKEVNRMVEEYSERSANAVLRLIAGILGVSFGKLKERDKSYQLKRARIGSAVQSTQLANAIQDQDPLKALREALHALSVLEKEDPSLLPAALNQVHSVLSSGRCARIGENVEQVLLASDEKSILLVHTGGIIECIGLKNLNIKDSYRDVSFFSDAWGPDGAWHIIESNRRPILLDMRSGRRGLQKFGAISKFISPADESWWQPLASDNHSRGVCSASMGWCFVTSINDHDEWAAVDSFVNFVDLTSGKCSKTDDVYELISNERADMPAVVLRKNKGWFLYANQNSVFLGDGYKVSKCKFSPSQLHFLALSKEQVLQVFSVKTLALLFELPAQELEGNHITFSWDDEYILSQSKNVFRILSVPGLSELARLEGDFELMNQAEPVEGVPGSWQLSGTSQQKFLVFVKPAVVVLALAIDMGGRLAVLESPKPLLFDIKNCRNIQLDFSEAVFASNPSSMLFATSLNNPDEQEYDAISPARIDVRLINDPERVIHSTDRLNPSWGDGSIGIINTSKFMLVWSFEREVNPDPPFQERYNCSTDLFDLASGCRVHGLPFAVKEARESGGDIPVLTYLRGSSGRTTEDYAVLNNQLGKIIWKRDTSDPEVERIEIGDSIHHQVFVVINKRAAGSVCSVEDGKRLAVVPGVTTKVKFDTHNSGLFAIWFKDGRAEIWRADRKSALHLATLGLIVSDVQFVGNEPFVIVHHADGRVYLLSTPWLLAIAGTKLPTQDLLEQVRSHEHSPTRSAWWNAGHPRHYPFYDQNNSKKQNGHTTI